MAGKLYLLTRASLLDRLRWAVRHLYALLVLGPVMLGMTYLTLTRAASYDLALEPPALPLQLLLAVAFVVGVITVNLSRSSRELYHLREATAFTEALPLPRTTHLHFALATRAAHTLLLALALVMLHSVSGNERIVASSLVPLLIFSLLVALGETFAALNWIHWGHRRRKQTAALAFAALVLVAMLAGLLLLLFFNASAAVLLTQSFAQRLAPSAHYFVYITSCLIAASVYALTRAQHERWRAEDIDYAQRLEQKDWLRLNPRALFTGRLGAGVRAMITRDLRLTARVFSSALYVAFGFSVLSVIMLVTLLTSGALPSAEEALGGLTDFGWMSATWLPSSLAIKTTAVVVASALGSVVPVLVSYQLPHTWLERALGTTGTELWEGKLWYTKLVTLPAVVATYTLGALACVFTGGAMLPVSYLAPLLAECLWLWWLVSTICGALAYEMPDRPELALVLILSLCLTMGILSAVLWPMGVGLYGLSVAQARERGRMQAARYLVTEET